MDKLFGQIYLTADIMDQEDPTLQGRAPSPLLKNVGNKQEKQNTRDQAEALRLHREGNAHMSKKVGPCHTCDPSRDSSCVTHS